MELPDCIVLIVKFVFVFFDLVIVIVDAFCVFHDVLVVVLNTEVKLIDVPVKLDQGLSECFECDHKISFGIESFLIFLLFPDRLPLVEVPDLTFEISRWDMSVVRLFELILHLFWVVVSDGNCVGS